MSGLGGFLTSEQYTNLEWGDGFRSDADIRAENAKFAKLEAMRVGETPELTPEGHSIFKIRGRELESNDSNLGQNLSKLVGKRHYFGELDMGTFTELQTKGVPARNTFLTGSIFDVSAGTLSALGTNDVLISTTLVHGSELMRAASVWQMRHEGKLYSVGPCDCRVYTYYLQRRSTVY